MLDIQLTDLTLISKMIVVTWFIYILVYNINFVYLHYSQNIAIYLSKWNSDLIFCFQNNMHFHQVYMIVFHYFDFFLNHNKKKIKSKKISDIKSRSKTHVAFYYYFSFIFRRNLLNDWKQQFDFLQQRTKLNPINNDQCNLLYHRCRN